jgi:imidazolonepropionase-like amidohydrolase
VNPPPAPPPTAQKAIVGATLIDGRGGPPVADATVVVRGSHIVAAGPRASVAMPAGAERVDGRGMTVLPGLIDAHFHLSGGEDLPELFLASGVTSARDPGEWIEEYDSLRSSGTVLPRLFLTGPHLDTPPPAYPTHSLLVRDEEETRRAVEDMVRAGASAIKVYFRLPLGLIGVVTRTAHAHGLPVVAHLEIVDARDAIRAGIDGIEHVTSVGTALVPPQEAEGYRQAVLADNAARGEGRYRLWSGVDLDSPWAREMIDLLVARQVFLAPTFTTFERRRGDRGATETQARAFRNMLRFVGMAHRAGAAVVVGSHSTGPYAPRGLAFQREMELLVEAGLTPLEAIVAGTLQNARFLRIADRLGTVEPGKLADLVLVEGNPAEDIRAMREVRRVMLNGRWVR